MVAATSIPSALSNGISMISLGNLFPLFCLPLTSSSVLICLARRQHQCLMGRSCSFELDRSMGDWLTTSQYNKARSISRLLFSRAPLCLARSGEGRHCPCICCTKSAERECPDLPHSRALKICALRSVCTEP